MARWHSCNVLQSSADARRLWQFDARNGDFKLSREQTTTADGALPGHLVNKSWRSLWQPRLNVAWLPPESVFLRVVHLPASNFEETLAMVELQLEKVSPIPVTQVVWSIHRMPQAAENLQTLIVVLAERKAVEEFLGRLEGQGYLADRLELGVLDQLQATPVTEDGAWIYPGAWGGHNTALAAWWYGGVLQNLNFLTLPLAEDRAAGLKEQLAQMSWAGELEGWLTSPPAWHLVADDATAAEWEPGLRQAAGDRVVVSAPLNPPELAALTARRAAQTDTKTNLLPAEFATRYRQQFVDRLWMRGLGALGVLYAIVIAIYFAALSVQTYRVGKVESQVKATSLEYTNAMQMRARYDVLKDRQDLKFAALDCWKAVAELLPETVTMDAFNLVEGRRLTLNGTAPADQRREVLDFVEAMRKATVNSKELFDQSKDPGISQTVNPGGATVRWSFVLELIHTDAK